MIRSSKARETEGDKGEIMKANAKRTAGFRHGVLALFAALLLGLAVGPAVAGAAKIDNPSPPNFRAEITSGFLQLVTTASPPLVVQLPMDFASYDPPLPNPTLTGTVTTDGNGYGVINVPQAGINFAPIPVDVSDFSLIIRIQPVGAATGKIDPLKGRVDLALPIRLKIEGAAMGQALGDSCFVGSAGSPINLATTTNVGTFPATNPTPDQAVAMADFIPDGSGFMGGWMAAEPYSDEAGVWPTQPIEVPGKPVGNVPRPLPSELPYNPLTDFIPRAVGSWRGVNETFAAPKAVTCGTGLLQGTITDQLNTQLGLPTVSGASTASFDFKFAPFNDRPTMPNAIVNKAVKSKFIAPGLSSNPWPNSQTPVAVSSQSVTLNASSSYFKMGPHPSQTYAFDTGSGTFGAPTTNPVTSFTAPFIPQGDPPQIRAIRVKATDSEGDSDISTRYIKVVPATDITLGTEVTSVAGTGKLRAGSNGHIKFNVTNSSATDASSATIAFDANLPVGVTLDSLNQPNGWSCSHSPSSISCSLPQGALAAQQTDQFDATVAVDTGAANPANVTASAVMTGDPNPGNNSVNQNIPVVKTDLAVNVSHSGDLVANGWFPYTVAVSNVGDGATAGGSTVDVALPAEFTYRAQGSGGSGWTCSPANPQSISCTRTAEIAGGAAAPDITIWARIDRSTPQENRTVSAVVSTQGDVNAFGGANTSDDTDMVWIRNDLAAHVSISGSFKVGDPGQITYSVANESVVDGTVPTTIESALPAGMTVSSVSGSGWDCSATVPNSDTISCEHAAGIAGGSSTADLTATVDVAQAAYPGQDVPVQLTNSQDAFAPNNNDTATVQVKRLDVMIQKLAVKPFNVGIEGRYRLNVTNIGDAETVGDITVTDTLPAGLKIKGVSGAGWDCSASVIGGQDVTCVMTNPLGPAVQAAPIEIRVDVLDAAADAGTVTNTAYVDTPRDDRSVPADAAVTGNNSSTVETSAVAVDLSIESRHQGVFRVGTDDLYSLDIRNVGFFGTDPGEPITVTDDLPDGIVPDVSGIEATRPGWDCVEDSGDVTCTLEAPDALTSAMNPETSVTIDIPVHVTDAAADTSDNVAEVSTARDSNPTLSPNNIATDPTTVHRIDLSVSGSVSIPPRAGGIGQVTVNVHNGGSAATVQPTTAVMDLAPAVSFRPAGSTTTGWTCASPGAGTQVTCTRSQSIPAGADAPVLKLRTNVGAAAPASWTTTLTTATNGEPATRLADNTATVNQDLETIDLALTKDHDPAAVKAGKRASYKIHVANIGNTATTAAYRVQDNVNGTFQNVSASGAGWNCTVTGNAVDCSRTASLGAGAPAPDITVSFDIPVTAAGTRNSLATVSSTDDPFTANNTFGDPIVIVATADVTVDIDQPTMMRVGDDVGISYKVSNVGTDSTAGAPSVTLKVGVSSGLKPVGFTSGDGDWSCDPVEANDPDPGSLDCEYGGVLPAGGDSTVVGQFEVIPTNDPGTASMASVNTPGDVNPNNNYATATSSLQGIDLEATVAAAPASTEYMVAGTTATRVVTVTNAGTSATTAPIRVSVDLPTGVQWDSGVANGSGWTCSQQVRTVTCVRSDQLNPAQTAPALSLGLRPSRSNAPSVDITYVVSTAGDENASNDSPTRTEEVRYNPDTTITSAPSGTTTSKTASIAFESDDNTATFECKVDSGAFAACTSPFEVSGLIIGSHTVQVRAVNGFGLADLSPAEATWEVQDVPLTGPSKPLTLKSTGGTLTIASLGSVPLPDNQVKLDGRLYTDSGGIKIPKEGVSFAPVVQTIPDVLGPGTTVEVTIAISATADGSGMLPTGGGPGSLVLPVRADVGAKLGNTSLFPPGTECALTPITFDLAGNYNETGKSLHVEQNNVAFPLLTGCPGFKETIEQLLELPRNDIEMALDFSVDIGSDGGPVLAKPKVTAPKKVKSGKKFKMTVKVKNTGVADATNVRVCLTAAKKMVSGKCAKISRIKPGKTGTAKLTVKSKKVKKNQKITYTVKATAAGARKGELKGHVTLIK